jgi:hypothetical protein
MATNSIADVLNTWDNLGVFDYAIPFLLIFAVVFGILQKAKIFGDAENNKGINAVISFAIGFLALQFNLVSDFFELIFPRFGIGLAVFLVLIIAMGFFSKPEGDTSKLGWVGAVVGIGVVIWAWDSWDYWTSGSSLGAWISEWFWAIVILGLLAGGVVAVTGGFNSSE